MVEAIGGPKPRTFLTPRPCTAATTGGKLTAREFKVLYLYCGASRRSDLQDWLGRLLPEFPGLAGVEVEEIDINALEFRPFIENVFVDLNVDRGDPDDLENEINGLDEADADFETEVMFGTQFYIKWWATEFTAIQLTHEFAQDSEIFYSHMAPFQSLKVTADVTF